MTVAPASPSLAALVAELQADRRLGPQLRHAACLPPEPAQYAPLDPPLPAVLAGALASRGVERLWSHQAEALAAVRRGEHTLVTTPTASGKSLVFQLPVLEAALAGAPGRALFLFPLKALGQDQRGKFQALAAAAGLDPTAAGCEIYDGDTPTAAREALRQSFPRVVITNPDMAHLALLGNAPAWAPFLRDLRWLVLDELHTYRGIFGAHFHHVLQRLLRLARAEGSAPTLIASSATAANAGEFAELLAGVPFHWVAGSGAPREARHFLLFEPAASAYTTALQLFVRLLEAGLKTIVFTKARRITELLYSWLGQQHRGLARRVASYRAGFLPSERRKIEADLWGGRLDGVISTSALEMGIDVGGLDACILVGFPGSVMATWQRSGRVGRGGRDSLTALVAMPDALDQYLLAHPEELLGRPCERLVVDPGNEVVARQHLVCAAAERPLARGADAAYLERHAPLIGDLLREHRLIAAADGDALHARARRPQRAVNLRGTGASFAILEQPRGTLLGTVDGARALHECHAGAIYLHRGRQYAIESLDLERREVRARAADVDYFTSALADKETTILELLGERRDRGLAAWLARLRVTERVTGFERKRLMTQELIDQQPLSLPPTDFETVGLFWVAPPALAEELSRAGRHFLGALHAAEHATIALFPLLAMCDRNDLGGISLARHPQLGSGAVFVYDGHPGGVGIAARGFAELPDLLRRVEDLLARCPCDDGCPSCVQSPKCGNGNRPLDKEGARGLLAALLAADAEAPAVAVQPAALESGAEAAEQPAGGRRSGEPWRRREPLAPSTVEGADGVSGLGDAGDAGELGGRGEVGETADAGAARETGTARPAAGSARPRLRRAARGPQAPGGEKGAGEAGQPGPAAMGEGKQPPIAAAEGTAAAADEAPAPPSTAGPASRRRAPAAARADDFVAPPRRTVLFDLETLRSAEEVGGWNRAHRMGLAVGVVCHLEENRFAAFRESQVGELVAALRAADLVVGFNVKRFDYAVLGGYTGEDYTRTLPTLDLLEEIWQRLGFRLGLDHLAAATLGAGKSADGLQSLEWVRAGRLDLVEEYCRHDVEILRDLYLFGRREGHVRYRDKQSTLLRLPVDW